MRTSTKNDIRARISEVSTWPTIREVADEWELPERYVRSVIERGRVEAVKLDLIRVNPDDWETFIEDWYAESS